MKREKFFTGGEASPHKYTSPEEEAVSLLREKGLTVAAGESCTGGLLSGRITAVAGASEVFLGAVVSYANKVKEKLLFVDEEMLIGYGAVSAVVACEMARGARLCVGSHIGIGITGIAGPGSDGTEKPVGLVYIALCDGERVLVREIRSTYKGEDVRSHNRLLASTVALEMIIDYIKADGRLPGMENTEEFISRFRN